MLLFVIPIILVLITIAYFDIKERAVYWWLYVLFGIISFTFSLQEYSIVNLLQSSAINLFIVFFQLLFVQLYMYVKTKKFELVFKNQFGIGDFIFLVCLSFALPTLVFIPFLVLSFLISLILHFLCVGIFSSYKKTVPLAGFVSICLIPVIAFKDLIHIYLYSFI